MNQTLLLFSTALVSGLLATLITIGWQRKNASYDRKFRVFKALMSQRYIFTSEESVNSLNSIDVIFYRDKKVRDAYKAFWEESMKKPELSPQTEEKYLKLLEAIAVCLKLKDIHWDEIKHFYYPNGLAEKKNEEAVLRKLQIQNVSLLVSNTRQEQNTPNNGITPNIIEKLLPRILENPGNFEKLIEISEKMKKKDK